MSAIFWLIVHLVEIKGFISIFINSFHNMYECLSHFPYQLLSNFGKCTFRLSLASLSAIFFSVISWFFGLNINFIIVIFVPSVCVCVCVLNATICCIGCLLLQIFTIVSVYQRDLVITSCSIFPVNICSMCKIYCALLFK